MKRFNGNRYERKRHHQVSDNLRYPSYRDHDMASSGQYRARERKAVNNTSLEDDWDVTIRPHAGGRWGRRAPYVRYYESWRGSELDRRVANITTEELHHQPQWVQHRWRQQEGTASHHENYNSWNRSRSRARQYDFEKVLSALEAASHDPDKLWALEYYERKTAPHLGGSSYGFLMGRIAISDLRQWLTEQSTPTVYSRYQYGWFYMTPEKQEALETADKAWRRHVHRIGFYDHICSTLLKMGYDVYKEPHA